MAATNFPHVLKGCNMSDSALLSIDVEFPGPRGGAKKKTLRFKNLNEVPLGIFRANRNDQAELSIRTVEWACSADDLEVLDALPANKFWEVYVEMQKASSVDVGESSASSTS